MRLTLHILRKDIRRLWWEAAIATGALAMLARMDAQRADFIPSALESMFNLLVPAAWAYVIVLLIHQESLVGDTQFWTTRPYPRAALVAAKLLFLVIFIHLPYLIASALIVVARGFDPLIYLTALLWKQLLAAVVVTLPATALAAVTRNLAQFLSAAATIAIAAALLVEGSLAFTLPWVRPDSGRLALALALVTCTAIAIVTVQYWRMRTFLARLAAILGTVAAAAAFSLVPMKTTVRLPCSFENNAAPPISIQLDRHADRSAPAYLPRFPGRREAAAIPVAISGVPAGGRISLLPLDVAVSCGEGIEWRTTLAPRDPRSIEAYLWLQDQQIGWQIIALDPAVARASKCTVIGEAAVSLYQSSPGTSIAVGAGPEYVRGVGRCSDFMVSGNRSEEMLKVMCESPEKKAPLAQVILSATSGGRDWKHRLADSMPTVPYINSTWLSPVHRRQTFFHLVEGRPTHEGSRWLVPRDDLDGAIITIAPEHLSGCGVIRYELRDLDLRQFVFNTRG